LLGISLFALFVAGWGIFTWSGLVPPLFLASP
jgi:hypothetical protein